MSDSGAAESFLVPTSVTFLQMTAPPPPVEVPEPQGFRLRLMRAERCSVPFYRWLYDAVGGPWCWVERKRLSDSALAAIVQHPLVEITVLYADGVPAGYAELDFRRMPEVNLAYFGIMVDFTGRRLGPFLLNRSIQSAWRRGVRRLTVNTCTLDHPAALPLYRRCGFVPYARRDALLDTRV